MPKDEASVLDAVRLEASRLGIRLWRNNVGAGQLTNGNFIRWGLANDSATVNKFIKSADLVGIRPVLITQEHVGKTFGQFISREIKHTGWRWRGDERETAQKRWADLVASLGGDACFATGEGSF